jgi:CheY-like chemotaxis protein
MYDPYSYHFRSVLLVEDDPFMQKNLARLVQSIDKNIIVDRVATAEEAKDLVDHRDDLNDYDLVISDQFLKGQATGLELWEHCQRKHPDMPFMLTSGTNLLESLSHSKKIESCPPFLKKPFSNFQGRFVIKDLLERPALSFSFGTSDVVINPPDMVVGSAMVLFSGILIWYSVSVFEANQLSMREIMEAPPVQKALIIERPGPTELVPLPATVPNSTKEEVDWNHINLDLWTLSLKVSEIRKRADEIILQARLREI